MGEDVAGCTGKRSFPNYRRAARRAYILNRRKNRGDEHMEAYHCHTCSKYHLGRTDKDRSRFLRLRWMQKKGGDP